MEPVLKWAGGKRQILSLLNELIPTDSLRNHTLFEPFVGAGSVFLSLEHNSVVINDYNAELINVYEQIRDNPIELIELLNQHNIAHNRQYFYETRNLDRTLDYNRMTNVEKAARTIYLNRTCFNGLYRVNGQGYFNVPIGSYVTPQIVREQQIQSMSRYLNNADVRIECGDFEQAIQAALPGDTVYFDPPYDYDDQDGFIRYTADQFEHKDLIRLKRSCDQLIDRGCRVILSNNDTRFVNEIFDEPRYEFIRILGRRMINNTSDMRHGVNEVIIIGNQ